MARRMSLSLAQLALAGGLLLARPAPGNDEAPYQVRDLAIQVEGAVLEARLYSPAQRGGKYPLIITVAGSGPDGTIADPYTRLLVDTWTRGGLGVLAFNKRGVGHSTGVQNEVDFEERARDVADVFRVAKGLPGVDAAAIGAWGISQAGWVLPKAAALAPGLRFLVLVSPAGVNPARQTEYFLAGEFRKLKLSQGEAQQAVALFHTILTYYATGNGHESAQAAVDRVRATAWYPKVEKHPFWHDMAAPGAVYDPSGLKRVIGEKPGDFTWTLAPSTFADFGKDYQALRVPVLIIYGGRDELVPITESRAVFETAFQHGEHPDVTFRTFPEGDHDIQVSPSAVAKGYRECILEWIRARTK